MALLTAEAARTPLRITMQYRLLRRGDNGDVQYGSINDTEGTELLTVYADGSMSRHIIVGVCRPCMETGWGDGPGLRAR